MHVKYVHWNAEAVDSKQKLEVRACHGVFPIPNKVNIKKLGDSPS